MQNNENSNDVISDDDVFINSEKNLVHAKNGKIISLINSKDMTIVDTSDALPDVRTFMGQEISISTELSKRPSFPVKR